MSLLKKFGLLLIGSLMSLQSAHATNSDEFNFRFSPVGLLFGIYSVSLDYVLTPEWTVGPTVNYLHWKFNSSAGDFTSDLDVKGFGVGARANWFSNGVFTNGFYVGPSLEYATAKATASDGIGEVTASVSTFVFSALGGYAWFWDSFNIMTGIGFSAPLGKTEVIVKDENGNESTASVSRFGGLALEFSLGWTF